MAAARRSRLAVLRRSFQFLATDEIHEIIPAAVRDQSGNWLHNMNAIDGRHGSCICSESEYGA